MSGNPPHLREPVDSLLRLQEPTTRPCSGADHTSSCSPSHFHKIARNISFPSTPGSSKWSLSGYTIELCTIDQSSVHSQVLKSAAQHVRRCGRRNVSSAIASFPLRHTPYSLLRFLVFPLRHTPYFPLQK